MKTQSDRKTKSEKAHKNKAIRTKPGDENPTKSKRKLIVFMKLKLKAKKRLEADTRWAFFKFLHAFGKILKTRYGKLATNCQKRNHLLMVRALTFSGQSLFDCKTFTANRHKIIPYL